MAIPADILWSRVICKQPGRYIGWPTIVRCRGGALAIVFSGDRDEHVCPWGKTHFTRSDDDGETWSDPQVISDTPLDDRDAGIVETASGKLVVSWFTSTAFEEDERYRQHAATLSQETRQRWLGSWVQGSVDGGTTWSEPTSVSASAPHGPVQLADGRLLYLGTGTCEGERTVVAEESRDDGLTWTVIGTVSHPPESAHRGLGEPHLVETASGKLVGLFRVGGEGLADRYLYQSDSTDGGRTWSPARATSMLGFPPHLIRLQDDRLLVVFGLRLSPFGQRACFTSDEGETWDIDTERILQAAPNNDLIRHRRNCPTAPS